MAEPLSIRNIYLAALLTIGCILNGIKPKLLYKKYSYRGKSWYASSLGLDITATYCMQLHLTYYLRIALLLIDVIHLFMSSIVQSLFTLES